MSAKILVPGEIDTSRIVVGKVVAQKPGGPKVAKVSYDNHEFVVECPLITIPWGLSEPLPEYRKPGEFKFALNLELDTNDKELSELKKKFEEIDDFNINYITEHSTELIDLKYAPLTQAEVRKSHYSSLIKAHLDKTTKQKTGKFNDWIKVKLPFYNVNSKNPGAQPVFRPSFKVFMNSTQTEVNTVNEDGTPNWSWVSKGMKVIPIIKSEGFLVIGNRDVYNSWRFVGLKICEVSNKNLTIDTFRTKYIGSKPAQNFDETQVEDEPNFEE